MLVGLLRQWAALTEGARGFNLHPITGSTSTSSLACLPDPMSDSWEDSGGQHDRGKMGIADAIDHLSVSAH